MMWCGKVPGMRRTVAIGLLAVMMAACGGGGEDAVATTTTEAAETTTTSTTAATTTTTTEAVPFDIEVKRAAIALLEIRNDVFQDPDVSRVSEYISSTCVCLERERGGVERFVREGLHWTTPAIEVRGIHLSSAGAENPVLTLVARQAEGAILYTDGTVDEPVPPEDELPYSVSLVRDDGGEWRINYLDVIFLNEDSTNRVIAEGTP